MLQKIYEQMADFYGGTKYKTFELEMRSIRLQKQ